jgi:DNA-directed RNA polymerase specialized sigma subunit
MRIRDEDVRDVWLEYKKTGAQDLRNQLIENYLPVVRFIAERLLATLPSFVELDDLRSMARSASWRPSTASIPIGACSSRPTA